MSKNILFVTEGKRAEPRFLEKFVALMRTYTDYKVFSYGTNLYKMIDGMFIGDEIDRDLDFIDYLRSCKTGNNDPSILDNKFSDIFLIFDMDPHDHFYDPERMLKALRYFSDSTDNGKLYINYPMFESVRHITNLDDLSFLDLRVNKDEIRNYKRIVNEQGLVLLSDKSKIDETTMMKIIVLNLRKANMMIGGSTDIPTSEKYEDATSQQGLFVRQNEEYVNEGKVFVLNTCIFNTIDYNPGRFFETITRMGL